MFLSLMPYLVTMAVLAILVLSDASLVLGE